MNPITYNLSRLEWDFFGTLTFRTVPPSFIQKRCIFHFLRLVGQGYGTQDWKWKLRWVVRHELGEISDRPHFHFVLKIKLDHKYVNPVSSCYYLKSIWENEVAGAAGFADIRLFDPNKSGIEYIMKAEQGWFSNGANQYEINKFYFANMDSIDFPLLIAPSALWDVARSKRSKVGSGGDNSSGLAQYLRSLKAGKSKVKAPVKYSPPNAKSLVEAYRKSKHFRG